MIPRLTFSQIRGFQVAALLMVTTQGDVTPDHVTSASGVTGGGSSNDNALNNDTACLPKEGNATSLAGNVAWTDPDPDCDAPWTWAIEVDELHAIGLHFHDVQMTQGRTLMVLSLDTTLGDWTVERRFSENNYSVWSFDVRIDLSPLLVNRSTVRLSVGAAEEPGGEDGPDRDPQSFFNVSYVAHDKLTFPRSEMNSENTLTYYCQPGSVPQVLRCNKVQDCDNNEDEEDCEYRRDGDTAAAGGASGCEAGWVPYADQCLKFDFSLSCHFFDTCDEQLHPGYAMPTLPEGAALMCRSWYGDDVTLAVLPDEEGLRLAADVIQQMGFRSVSLNIRKFQSTEKRLKALYRYAWQWGGRGGPVAYERQDLVSVGPEDFCAMLDIYPRPHFVPTSCALLRDFIYPDGFVCAKPRDDLRTGTLNSRRVMFARATSTRIRTGLKACSDGSLVLVFERCLWGDLATGVDWSPADMPLFQCRFGQHVHYSLVCDGKGDCADGSDEEGCVVPRFPILARNKGTCDDGQLVSANEICDSFVDCFDGSDEEECTTCYSLRVLCPGVGCLHPWIGISFPSCPQIVAKPVVLPVPKPGVARLDIFGVSHVDPVLNASDARLLFECRPGFYIPAYMVANGEQDCQDGKDEDVAAENIVCPGFYRCQDYGNCLHPDLLCDAIYHCPNKDDELYCNTYLACPDNCTCEGYAIACWQPFDATVAVEARYVDLSGVQGVTFEDFHFMEFLQFLNLSRCGLDNLTLTRMPGLRILDVSLNRLKGLDAFPVSDMVGLTFLDLTGNPFLELFDSDFSRFLDAAGLVNLQTFVLRNTLLRELHGAPLRNLSQLTHLDLVDSPVEVYEDDVLQGLTSLAVLRTDDPKLCCPYFQPASLPIPQCLAPVDELSSCADLLGSAFLRVSLWAVAVLALTGNAGVILFRCLTPEKGGSPTFRILVLNLCGADLLMGVYLVVIGAADVHYRGVYVSVERRWRHSGVCAAAGVTGLVSSEVSTFLIALITLDRLVVVAWPLRQNLHLKAKSCVACCVAAWLLAGVLAVAPLLLGLQFYDVNAVCLPLPITRQRFTGQTYASGVFVALNLALMALIGAGQLAIYRSVRRATAASGVTRRAQETGLARRLFLVVLTDFCCWVPVGLMGLLGQAFGVPIPGQVNAVTAVVVLPLNSALNPFLYTLNSALERRRKRRLAERTRRVVSSLQAQIPTWPPQLVHDTVTICVKTKHVTLDDVKAWIEASAKPGGRGNGTGAGGGADVTSGMKGVGSDDTSGVKGVGSDCDTSGFKGVGSDYDTMTTSVSEN